ncbi:MAG: cell division protein DivIC [Olleya marilimosa]|jgi:cell division protein DivIC|uniref:Septum formation initiator family protein n=1 Tax=Olleya marilimosa TaxID=272164 RepID=A0ABR8LQI0_9FLAO|nr:septum formation initiator family protein [Olleya marilimosa]MBD3862483.1 septum formation initiator family protein [Olleya marilimosa]MBD3889981.1 septum formation initiator family protein [Olleya marilimosa]PIB32386.1 septum formation initiator [Gaetbulibacter sp. 5U11]
MKWYKNIYIIILISFCVWMIFFDTNSLISHHEVNQEFNKLEDEKEYYKKEIAKDKKAIKKLSTEDGLETFAREKYYMKKENEDIYIIEYEDSLKTKNND